MRRKIMPRDVEIEVETCDRTGTFLGSLWESKTNVAVTLLEAGLAKLHNSFGSDRIPDFHLLEQAEQSAKRQKLKIWENYVEGEEESNGATVESKQQEMLKVMVTEVLGGGKFYVQPIGDHNIESIQQQLAYLNLQEEAPLLGAFNPKKGDLVLCLFGADKAWYRAMRLREKAANRNEDEFYFKMVRTRMVDGVHMPEIEANKYNHMHLKGSSKLKKTTHDIDNDLGCLLLKVQAERKKIERLTATLHSFDTQPSKKRIFVAEDRKTNRSYKELEESRNRLNQLEKNYNDMAMQKELQKKGKKRKLREDEIVCPTTKPIYKWRAERKH